MNLGERLKAERERLGYNQTDFAALAGASKHSQINWEKGAAAPNATVLAAWAEHGLDVLYVVTGVRGQAMTYGSNVALTAHLTKKANPVTHSVVAEPLGEYRLNQREKALIENYRGSDEEGRRAMESTASALAHKDRAKEKRQGGE
ncbi:helix-turn-helix transcriptional regulator [Pseudomonas aeruginosa]|uniref:Repressor n=3 Tax=root TaxID=1 RepID=A0A5A4MZB1_9CAUD|nr:repressor [Pseudomonas phage Ps60]EIU2578546.1 helix-turn-helix transcriptional regulator [Pseudomonas aeruginosa]AYD80552.1 repressor [Pseudomonas phage Ps60]EIU2726296.1 helix-turn-helix transcriptional regulator [Pseudomonas aeruginosa]EIW4158013.1 helix-turn-helix transcriptional regulator [Pseudomonas aeruginosa]EJH4820426.1 helix-turn-helix transcriptional regulator [Pseudomonas aeruginosa]